VKSEEGVETMRRTYLEPKRLGRFVAVGVLLAVSASLLVTGCKGQEEPKATGEPSLVLSKEALKGRLGDPELIVIDVRMSKAWEDCDSKITGARREDPGTVSTWTKHYGKDKTIVLYCSCDNEGTSKHVAKQLRAGGFEDVYALTGGWKAWIEADYPTEKKS
jgi:rhodanese-related sulfurtransferase